MFRNIPFPRFHPDQNVQAMQVLLDSVLGAGGEPSVRWIRSPIHPIRLAGAPDQVAPRERLCVLGWTTEGALRMRQTREVGFLTVGDKLAAWTR